MRDKNYTNDAAQLFQELPGIDTLLQLMTAEISAWGRDAVVKNLREYLDPRH